MSPVEISRGTEKTVRLEFVEDTCYAGVDFGPNYPSKVAEVREDWARYFVRRGKARPATDVPAEDNGDDVDPASDDAPAADVAEGESGQLVEEGESGQLVEEGAEIEWAEEGEAVVPEPIPEDFPGATALAEAGILTVAALDAVPDLTDVPGIGERTAERIREARAEMEDA